jgi:hypothetical protein
VTGHDEPAYGDGSFSWYKLPSLGSKAGCSRQTCNEVSTVSAHAVFETLLVGGVDSTVSGLLDTHASLPQSYAGGLP